MRIYHDFVQGQGNPPECQRFAVHDKACGGWISMSLFKVMVSYFSPTSFNPHSETPLVISKCFLDRKHGQLGAIMTSRHCMIYGITMCSLKRSCCSRNRLKQLEKDSIVNSTGNTRKTLSEMGEEFFS